ncbi:hypothetical protein [Chryseobacterium sp.]|uniref:hypothetical protein n=1 Tax=Chryseobacterium sp. TaxID=1871047 RepID=UPI00289D617B|nr:hypothetical protein [Chryseobacterium sp.]
MKILCFLFCIGFGFFSSAQQKKEDSAKISKEIFEYKPRIFYPYDCSCPDRVIYKEVKKGDKNFNPYEYKEIRPIIIDSLKEEDKKQILDYIRKA